MMCNRRSNEIFNLILNKDIYEISDRIEAKERERERKREKETPTASYTKLSLPCNHDPTNTC